MPLLPHGLMIVQRTRFAAPRTRPLHTVGAFEVNVHFAIGPVSSPLASLDTPRRLDLRTRRVQIPILHPSIV